MIITHNGIIYSGNQLSEGRYDFTSRQKLRVQQYTNSVSSQPDSTNGAEQMVPGGVDKNSPESEIIGQRLLIQDIEHHL